MRRTLLFLWAASLAFGQAGGADALARAEQALGWRVAVQESNGTAASLGAGAVEVSTRQLAADAPDAAVDRLRADLRARQLSPLVYRIETPVTDWTRAAVTAARLGAQLVVVTSPPAQLDALATAAAQRNLTVALDATSGALLDADRALAIARQHAGRVRLWVSPAAWEKAGTKPLAALSMLREHLAGASLTGQRDDEFMREAYRLSIRPLVWTVPAADVKRAATLVDQLAAYHQNYASRTQGLRRLAGVSPEERQRLEAALPAATPVAPKRPRKLLVFDLNVGRLGHPSIPYANLAMQLMGRKTGAFEATVSSDPAVLQPARLREFDAVYLNNTIGDIFGTAEVREGFAAFVRDGGGVMANHASTVTATEWSEFGEILGARGASHRMTDERVVINVEDAGSPIVRAFGGAPFEYADEIFRFQAPYSRDKVRVLLSMDPVKTDLNQGRCFGQCYRDDEDYPIAWIRQHGKGRVFYTTLGHNPHVFWQPKLLDMFLAAAQYVLGDLPLNATPLPRVDGLDRALSAVSQFDWGQDEGPVRGLDRAMGRLGPGPQPAREAEQKLLNSLKGTAKLGAKDAITRQLAVVGSAASVPVLAPMMDGEETAGMARYALERIEGPEAAAALRAALEKAGPRPRLQAGLLHSLARRKDAASLPLMQRLMGSAEPAVAAAAVNALGILGTPEAERALLAAQLTPGVADALLSVAEQSAQDRAVRIYTRLAAASNPDQVRVAAVHGLARQGTSQAVADALRDASPAVQSAAVVNLAPEALLAAADKLTPALKIQALAALASGRQRSARPAFLAAAGSDDPAIRIAALRGLATLGSPDDVPVLVKAASTATGDEQAAARAALTRLPGADAGIVAALASAQGKVRVELLRAAGQRGTTAATDALLASARDSDPAIRREALRALREVASPDRAATLLSLLAQSGEDDRADAERALASAVSRADRPDVGPLIEAYEKSQDGGVRASLVNVLALTRTPAALPALRKALDAGDTDVQRAAVSGLSEWTTPDPMEDLIRVARSSPDAAVKVLALRGYVRLVQRPSGRPPAETVALLGAAMSAASRPEEKKAVLAAVQRLVTPEALALAQAAASDPAVAAEAKLAAGTLERALAARER